MTANGQPRQCQPCTACCDGWLVINTTVIKACPGTPCQHISPAGCRIYEQRPVNPCRNFDCGWVRVDSPLPDWMRPDQSGAIVQFGEIKWQGHVLDLVVPVGGEVPERTLNWLMEFANRRQVPMVYAEHVISHGVFTGRKVMVYAHQPLRQALINWLNAGNVLW